MTVKSSVPQILNILGKDIYYPNTYYFSRQKTVGGQITLEFPLPMSPENLEVTIYSPNQIPFELKEYHAVPLIIKPLWMDNEVRKLIEFTADFSQQAGYLPLGNYINPTEEYVIMYKQDIDGITPARVNRITGLIKVSQKMFLRCTVPMRFYMMGHEMCHHTIPTPIEDKADSCSFGYYSKLGFPDTEAYYAMSKVFKNTNHPRIQKLTKEILLYDFSQRGENKYF